MTANAFGYILYSKEKQKLDAKINQFKSTVSTLQKVIELNEDISVIDTFQAVLNKRYAIMGDIYHTITERREAFQNMGENMDASKRKGRGSMEHYTPELTLIAAFREVATMAEKALAPEYIVNIKNKAKEVLNFVHNSRRYSRALYGDCIWKYKYNINATSYSEERVAETAIKNVVRFEKDSDLFKSIIKYEKAIRNQMKKITGKYNDLNVKY